MSEAVCLKGCGKVWPRDPALEVPCPTCNAHAGRRCYRPSGHPIFAGGIHAARDLLADARGYYGPCPHGICGRAKQISHQEILPGIPEPVRYRRPFQLDLIPPEDPEAPWLL